MATEIHNTFTKGVAGLLENPKKEIQLNTNMSILTIILCIILPPVAVILKRGFGADFIINLILSLIFWIPGVIHAFWICSKR